MSKTLILNEEMIMHKINRIAYQIYEENAGEEEVIIAGIANQGYFFAVKIAEAFKTFSDQKINLKEIKIDKVNPKSAPPSINILPGEMENKTVIIVDDVLNSGKTLIYGVKFFLDHPVKRIMTAVLIDRSHRNFPVRADFAGLRLSTTMHEHVTVNFEKGMEVYLE